MGLLGDFYLERGKGGCLTAFVLDGLLQCRPEIFDQPKGSDARGVSSMVNELDRLLQEVQGVVYHVGAGQIHLPLITSVPNPLCPKPCLPLTPFAHNPTWKMTPLPSCNNGSSLFPKKPTQLALPPLGRLKIHGRLLRRPSMTKAVRKPPFPLSRDKSARKPTKFLFQLLCASSTLSRRG